MKPRGANCSPHLARAEPLQSANQPRRTRRWHPDFDAGPAPDRIATPANVPGSVLAPAIHDVAIDFVDMSVVIDRIHAAFFYGRV